MLVSIASTRLQVPGAVEIGNIATRAAYRRRGLARQTVSALIRAHVAAGQQVFLMVFQNNRAAVQLYEGVGFVRLRPMFLLRSRLQTDGTYRHIVEDNTVGRFGAETAQQELAPYSKRRDE